MKRIFVIALLAGIALAALPFLFAEKSPRPYQGWVEADTLFIGAEGTARLEKLAVEDGRAITAGTPLFKLESAGEEAVVAAARAALARSQAELELAEAAQKRPEEIDVLRASEREAIARLALSEQELGRTRSLATRGTATQASLDVAIATETANRAALDSVRSQITLANLPAREQNLRQAKEAVAAAEADLASAEAALARRSVAAPAAGSIETVYYRVGEVVPAGRPVVASSPRKPRSPIFPSASRSASPATPVSRRMRRSASSPKPPSSRRRRSTVWKSAQSSSSASKRSPSRPRPCAPASPSMSPRELGHEHRARNR
jgi:HlyD family secretion protein